MCYIDFVEFLCETEETCIRKNSDEVTEELVKFLQFIGAEKEDSTKDFEDDFVKKLQMSVQRVKESREMEAKYMQLELMLKKERNLGRAEGKAEGKTEGKAECILDILSEVGEMLEELRNRILLETDLNTLNRWLKLAARSDSIDFFQNHM